MPRRPRGIPAGRTDRDMRALTKLTAGPGLELVDRPEPDCGPLEVKIRVLRAGLCGTDLHLEQWDDWAAATVHAPMIIGHEFYGEIVEIGSDVPVSSGLSIGDRVSGEGHVVCGHCRNCKAGRRHVCINTKSVGVNRDGAFADYVVIPATNAWRQPASIDPDLGAIFDPLGNATHTALQWPLLGEDVLITGAGPIGVMAAAIARHAGAKHVVVTDVSDYRLGLAKAAGADLVVNVGHTRVKDAQRELGMREGFDIGLEMSGAPSAVDEMLANLNHHAHDHPQGHLRAGDVRDLVPHVLDAGHLDRLARGRVVGDHPPLPGARLGRRLRRGPIRGLRQSRDGLELMTGADDWSGLSQCDQTGRRSD
jgi:threonine 3-dehydrogenase